MSALRNSKGAVKKQPHIVNARQRLYDLFAKLDCRERPIFTVKSGGAQATTHLSSPEHPSESFRREVRVANSVLRANDHRDVYNKTGAVFLQPLHFLSVVFFMNLKISLRMIAYGADIGSFCSDNYVPAVAAFPNLYLGFFKYLCGLNII